MFDAKICCFSAKVRQLCFAGTFSLQPEVTGAFLFNAPFFQIVLEISDVNKKEDKKSFDSQPG